MGIGGAPQRLPPPQRLSQDLVHVVTTVLAECVEALPAFSPMVTTKPLPSGDRKGGLGRHRPAQWPGSGSGRAVAGS
jgi:hypothetical protein